ncbi:MAG: sensor histidine kinase, partial [Miltoncostaeaceae bacterium]
LAHTARAVSLAEGADAVAAVAAREARSLVDADLALVAVREADGTLAVVAGAGWAPGDPLPAVLELGRGGDAAVVWLGREAAAVMATPGGGEPLGLLVAARRAGGPFVDDDLTRLGALADQAGVALAGAGLVERLRGEERERRGLAAALVRAQEEERRRVAEDVHDGPVQSLVGVSLLLDALATELRGGVTASVGQVERAAGEAREAVRTLRRAIGDLHPMALQEQGLPAALGALRRRLELQGLDVRLDVAAVADLEEPLRTVAYRTCQEAVANVLRHADARRVEITAGAQEGDLLIAVRDDGRGFDPATATATVADGHLGLAAMRERARAFGAEVTVVSREGRGTEVRLTLPGAAPPG